MFKLVVLVVLVVIGIPVGGSVMVRCDGSLDAALARVAQCPAAIEVLGPQVAPSFMGLSCGSSESRGAFAEASWETPIRGDASQGTLMYAAQRRAGGWQVLRATVEVGDLVVDVVPCGHPPDGSATAEAVPGSSAGDESACSAGDGAACNRLGVAWARGDLGGKNLSKAHDLYERACKAGDATGCANLGTLRLRDFADPAGARDPLQTGCRRGAAHACTGLGILASDGREGDDDLAAARSHFTAACDAADLAACGHLGRLLLRGLGGEVQAAQARALLSRACDAASPAACVVLGEAFAEGLGGDRDDARAVQLWLGACDARHAAGCKRLATLYAGQGADDQAERYLRRACAAGDAGACRRATEGPSDGIEAPQ